jgi:stage V sporulation protein AE
MIFINAFLLSGTFCMIAQIILDNFKITPGHVTSLFTVIGAILSFLGIYDNLIKWAGSGATILISNFGHMLFSGAITGYENEGLIGLFTGLLSKSSAAITAAVVFSFILTLIFKPKS